MSKVIAIFGAGVGLGASTARRFAREGFSVALVARRKDRLDALVEQLAVLPEPTSPVTSPIARLLMHHAMRAAASTCR